MKKIKPRTPEDCWRTDCKKCAFYISDNVECEVDGMISLPEYIGGDD